MTNEAERQREERMIDACAKHTWREGDRSDFEKQGIKNEEQLKEKLRETVNHPDTRSFKCQPKMDPSHPRQGEQFGREIHVLRQHNQDRGRMENTVVILNPSPDKNGEMTQGSAWVSKREQLEKLRTDEAKKHGIEQKPEVVIGGRPALRERDQHRQVAVVEQQKAAALEPKHVRVEQFAPSQGRSAAATLTPEQQKMREAREAARQADRAATQLPPPSRDDRSRGR